ncbi:hypothetical protein WA577_003326, partial [Blastocystis sp. JDR]
KRYLSAEENVPISGVLPGDLQSYSFIRKLTLAKNRGESELEEPAEEEFLSELRAKLQAVSIDQVESSSQKLLHVGDVGVILKSRVDENYQSILGMMNEDLDWFFAQIAAMREEFREDLTDHAFTEKMIAILQTRCLSEAEMNAKYGVRLSGNVPQVRCREYLLQVLIRLYIYKHTPDKQRMTPST